VSICPTLTPLFPDRSWIRLLFPAPVTPINAIIISGEEPDIILFGECGAGCRMKSYRNRTEFGFGTLTSVVHMRKAEIPSFVGR